jgi:hypothetical protein
LVLATNVVTAGTVGDLHAGFSFSASGGAAAYTYDLDDFAGTTFVVAGLTFTYGVIALGTNAPFVVIVLGIVLGVVWAFVAPVRTKRGDRPKVSTSPVSTSPVSTSPANPPEVSPPPASPPPVSP